MHQSANNFDETARGPWEWDVKRLATSVEICGRDRGFKKKDREAIVLACVEGYRKAMAKFATMGEMDVWYAKQDVEDLLSKVADEGVISKDAAKKVAKGVERAKKKDSSRAIAKFTEVVDGRLRIVSDPPMVIPLRDMAKRKGEGDYLAVADMRDRQVADERPRDARRVAEQLPGGGRADVAGAGGGTEASRRGAPVLESSSATAATGSLRSEAASSTIFAFMTAFGHPPTVAMTFFASLATASTLSGLSSASRPVLIW